MTINLPPRPDWHRHAACRGMPPEWWYPDDEDKLRATVDSARARRICAGCPVHEPCAAARETLGIWAGATQKTINRRVARQRERERRVAS